MDYAFAVRVSESFGDLLADFADAIHGDAFALFHGIGQRLPVHKLHHQEGHSFVFSHVEDGHDAGMSQGTGGACFAVEALAEFVALLACQCAGEDGFHGDGAVHGGVACKEHGTHGPVTQLVHNLVSPNFLRFVHSLVCPTLKHFSVP